MPVTTTRRLPPPGPSGRVTSAGSTRPTRTTWCSRRSRRRSWSGPPPTGRRTSRVRASLAGAVRTTTCQRSTPVATTSPGTSSPVVRSQHSPPMTDSSLIAASRFAQVNDFRASHQPHEVDKAIWKHLARPTPHQHLGEPRAAPAPGPLPHDPTSRYGRPRRAGRRRQRPGRRRERRRPVGGLGRQCPDPPVGVGHPGQRVVDDGAPLRGGPPPGPPRRAAPAPAGCRPRTGGRPAARGDGASASRRDQGRRARSRSG